MSGYARWASGTTCEFFDTANGHELRNRELTRKFHHRDTESIEIRRLHRLRRLLSGFDIAGEIKTPIHFTVFSATDRLMRPENRNLRNLWIFNLCVLCVSVVKLKPAEAGE